jgi:hypothetical protein
VKAVEGARAASIAIHSAFGTQIILGILTVLSGIAIWLAVLHQATGALLVAATVWGAHELGRNPSPFGEGGSSRRLRKGEEERSPSPDVLRHPLPTGEG